MSVAAFIEMTPSTVVREAGRQAVDEPSPGLAPAATAAEGIEGAQLSPEQLARRCQEGCGESFAQLVAHFEQRIFNYLLRILRNEHDAEDVTQDTFLKAFRNMQRYNAMCSFSTWLFTIAKHTALNHIRSAKRVEKLEPTEDVDYRNPAGAAEQAETASTVWQAARALKPQQYEVLWLRYAEGFSIEEAARIMGLNPIYAKVILHRARNALARKLQHRTDLLESVAG